MLAQRVLWLGVVSLVVLCWNPVPAGAAMYGFTPVSFNSGAAAYAVVPQLSLDVTQSGSQVLFTFANDGPVASTIAATYFDDGAGVLDSLLTPINGPGVSFGSGGNPANLPAPMVPYHFGANFWATADAPKGLGGKGVDNTGEFVTIPFTLADAKSLADLVAALDAGLANPTSTIGALRVGIDVHAIDMAGLSDAFILAPGRATVPGAVHTPLPGAVILAMLGLSAAGIRLRRFA